MINDSYLATLLRLSLFALLHLLYLWFRVDFFISLNLAGDSGRM